MVRRYDTGLDMRNTQSSQIMRIVPEDLITVARGPIDLPQILEIEADAYGTTVVVQDIYFLAIIVDVQIYRIINFKLMVAFDIFRNLV
jgi:hypothetical protein